MNNPLDSPFLHVCSCMEDARHWLSLADDVRVKFGKDVCSVLMFVGEESHVYHLHSSKLVFLFGGMFNQLIINNYV